MEFNTSINTKSLMEYKKLLSMTFCVNVLVEKYYEETILKI